MTGKAVALKVTTMIEQLEAAAAEALYAKALEIRDRQALGFWLPKIWHLALRHHSDAMIDLANWFSSSDCLDNFGKAADPFSAADLYRRAYRKGNARAAQHIARSAFNETIWKGIDVGFGGLGWREMAPQLFSSNTSKRG